jgi:hypothetical protein
MSGTHPSVAASGSGASLATGRSVTIPARWGTRLETGLDPVAPRLWSAATFADAISHTEVRYAHTGQGRNVNAAARGRERLLIGAREIEEACRHLDFVSNAFSSRRFKEDGTKASYRICSG